MERFDITLYDSETNNILETYDNIDSLNEDLKFFDEESVSVDDLKDNTTMFLDNHFLIVLDNFYYYNLNKYFKESDLKNIVKEISFEHNKLFIYKTKNKYEFYYSELNEMNVYECFRKNVSSDNRIKIGNKRISINKLLEV